MWVLTLFGLVPWSKLSGPKKDFQQEFEEMMDESVLDNDGVGVFFGGKRRDSRSDVSVDVSVREDGQQDDNPTIEPSSRT